MTKKEIPAPRKPNSFNFAEKMQELESLVGSLEADSDVENALGRYEQASTIAAELQVYLDTAENTIRTISHKFEKK